MKNEGVKRDGWKLLNHVASIYLGKVLKLLSVASSISHTGGVNFWFLRYSHHFLGDTVSLSHTGGENSMLLSKVHHRFCINVMGIPGRSMILSTRWRILNVWKPKPYSRGQNRIAGPKKSVTRLSNRKNVHQKTGRETTTCFLL